MTKSIYFDHAAATKVSQPVAAMYLAGLADTPGNQESIHQAGYQAKALIDHCSQQIVDVLFRQQTMSVCFTHTGTDAFNLIANLPGLSTSHVITTELEHPALIAALKRSGATIDFVQLRNYQIDPEDLKRKLRADTRMVAAFHVQSEVGLISDFSWVNIVRAQSPKAIIVADTIQSIAKMDLPEADIYLLSGHKIGSPGGAAIFYKSNQSVLKLFFSAVRSPNYLCGRVDAPLINALTAATIQHTSHRNSRLKTVQTINQMLRVALPKLQTADGKNLIVTIPEEKASCYILHFIAPGLQGAVLLRMLSEKSIFVSSGSACQAETDQPSPTLKALGLSEYGFSGIRLSFYADSTMVEANIFLEELQKILLNY